MALDIWDYAVLAANKRASIAAAQNTAAIADMLARQAAHEESKERARHWVMEAAGSYASLNAGQQYYRGTLLFLNLDSGHWRPEWFASDAGIYQIFSSLRAQMQASAASFEARNEQAIVLGIKLCAIFAKQGLLPSCSVAAHEAWEEQVKEQLDKWNKPLAEKYPCVTDLAGNRFGCVFTAAMLILSPVFWIAGIIVHPPADSAILPWLGRSLVFVVVCGAIIDIVRNVARKCRGVATELAMPKNGRILVREIREQAEILRNRVSEEKSKASSRLTARSDHKPQITDRWKETCEAAATGFGLEADLRKPSRLAFLVDRALAKCDITFAGGGIPLPVEAEKFLSITDAMATKIECLLNF